MGARHGDRSRLEDEHGDEPREHETGFVQLALVRIAASAESKTGVGIGTPTARVHTSQLSVDTDLEWDPSPEADLAGYEIVYRDTIDPYWTHTIKVDKGTTRYLVKGITKDNFLFGVRAVDTDGNRSPVAFPHPVP